jgi:ATP-dependent DNA helicase RecQ
MKVVIVAKTRMRGGACVGAVTFDGRSLRLIAADQEWNDQFNLEYSVGDVWDVDCRAPDELLPPHVENVVVQSKRKLPPIGNVVAVIEQQMPPRQGGLEVLFEGLAQATSAGALYVTERTGYPGYSTMFWRPDQPLLRQDDAKRIRYCYATPAGPRTLTFVGFQEPLPEIPAGSLLRVSLAHRWRPEDGPEAELRCYVQLSGWFMEKDQQRTVNSQQSTANSQQLTANSQQSTANSQQSKANSQQATANDAQTRHSQTRHSQTRHSQTRTLANSPRPQVATCPLEILKRVFGYDSFRPLQAEIIDNVLQKRDSLAIMPTGSGKSLCYQVPALLRPGLTVVVSPLISLMQDQVEQLQAAGVAAVFLNSTLSYQEYLQTTTAVRQGRIRLLYAAPETLLRPETLLLLEQCAVECLTIDEAHCISEWGHDFRPEYRQLVHLRRRLPGAVCLAVTATATEQVRQDIKKSLAIADADEFLASFDRENLFLAVEPKVDGMAQTAAFLQERRDEAGIIYCATQRQVDRLAEQLAARGFAALPYHAGLDDAIRRQNQRRFIYEEGVIVVATIAFGMGINKPNVRFVVHYDLPKNLESYYQQIGRAGRDGLRADCLLLFSYSDVNTIRFFINEQEPAQQRGAHLRLEALLRFVESHDCRRRPLITYFGETYEAAACDMCDNCTRPAESLVDLTIPAQKFLACVKRTGEFFGAGHVIDVLRGSRSQKVLNRGHDRLSTHNVGGEFSKKEWQYLARQFIDQGLLVQDMEHGSLKLTPKAYAVFKGEAVQGRLPETAPASSTAPGRAVHDLELFERLRAKRTELAQAAAVPPYVIFSDRTLAEMATYFPQSKQVLAQMHGVGEVKLARYGEEFLAIVRAYAAEKGLAEQRKAVTAAPSSRGNRMKEVVALLHDGRSVAEVAELFAVKLSTVVNHVYKAYLEGESLPPLDLAPLSNLPATEQQRVLDAFAELGPERLRPIFEALDEQVPYDELHLLRLHFLHQ